METEILLGALLIFAMRVCDVTLGTVRQILAIQGHGVLAAISGFVEVTIFIVAISKVIGAVGQNFVYVFAYAGGFAVGTLLGIRVESWIGLGVRLVRVITVKENDRLVQALRKNGFAVTLVRAEGMKGPVYVLFSAVKRKAVRHYLNVVRGHAPKAFYTVEAMRFSHGGILGPMRKGK